MVMGINNAWKTLSTVPPTWWFNNTGYVWQVTMLHIIFNDTFKTHLWDPTYLCEASTLWISHKQHKLQKQTHFLSLPTCYSFKCHLPQYMTQLASVMAVVVLKHSHKFSFSQSRHDVHLLPLAPSTPLWLPQCTYCCTSHAARLLRLVRKNKQLPPISLGIVTLWAFNLSVGNAASY